MKTSKFTDRQIVSIVKQAEANIPTATLCREHAMSRQAQAVIDIC